MKRFSGIARAAAVCLPAAALAQTAGPQAPPSEPPTALPEVEVVAPTPLLGTGVDRNVVPAQTQVLTGKDVTLQGPPSATRALENEAEGVHLNSTAGNPFQPDLFYHGFEASPLQGVPAGLAVYVNGARFNNPFGDTVNFDLIPDLAIDRMNLEGANPVFGLNALGGALNVQLKNGFTYHGGEVDIFGGSFGQVSGQFQYGKQSGNSAVYVAASGLHESGWRDFQSSGLKQFYGDLGWRSERAELHINVDAAQTALNGPGTVPVELLNADRSAQFTGPNWVKNDYIRLNLAGNYDISDTTSLQAVAYYDNFLQRVGNGNGSPLISCADGSNLLCESPGVVATDRNGNPIPAFLGADALYGSIAFQTTNTNGYGQGARAGQPVRRRVQLRRRQHAVRRLDPGRGARSNHAQLFRAGHRARTRQRPDHPGARHHHGCVLRRLLYRHAQHHPGAGRERGGAIQRGPDRYQGPGQHVAHRQSRLQPLQSGVRTDLQAAAGDHALWRLCRIEPRADPGGADLLGSGGAMQPGQFLHRRPRP
jgi:hypothetical protein